MDPSPSPVSFKACSRCSSRKVKCDGRVPSCSPCVKHGVDCNIVDHVVYSYQTVLNLQNRVRILENELCRVRPSPVEAATIAVPPAARHPDPLDDLTSLMAEEVGNLALGSNIPQRYVGNAAGATFARIFFKQLDLDVHGFKSSISQQSSAVGAADMSFDPISHRASLPSKAISQLLLSYYIAHVHIWWPIFHLPTLRSWFSQIYTSPRTCDCFHRYAIFMVLALGAHEAAGAATYKALHDIFLPENYYSTAMTFYDQVSIGTGLQSLQATLLLTVWMTRASNLADNGKLWQISRFAMSMAIELGCHRNNRRWDFGSVENEIRNRLWWSTYALERMIAVATGRVLSLRNHAIDAQFPRSTKDDNLTALESSLSPTVAGKLFLPAAHLYRLCSIGGDILESVYIARPRAIVLLSISDTLEMAESLRQRLIRWYSTLGDCALPDSRGYLELKVEYCLMVMLLNRPSPSFPKPSEQAVGECAIASREAIEAWLALLQHNNMMPLWRTFHDVLLTGLVWLYCTWRNPIFDETHASHYAEGCLSILEHLAHSEISKVASNKKFLQFFLLVRDTTLEKCRMKGEEAMQLNGQALQDSFGTNWMDECFEGVFLNDDAGFDIDFVTEERWQEWGQGRDQYQDQVEQQNIDMDTL